MNERGKFIVIYGANNLGKTMQVDLLVNALKQKGLLVKKLKYPIYDLKPTGLRINQALRGNLQISDLELQRTFAQNRRDYQPELEKLLNDGVWVVAEDYTGTGIAWGVVRGISLVKEEKMNAGLLKEDLAILLDGERFTTGIEKGHRYEESGQWEKARTVYLELAQKYDWKMVNANQSPEKVHQAILGLTDGL